MASHVNGSSSTSPFFSASTSSAFSCSKKRRREEESKQALISSASSCSRKRRREEEGKKAPIDLFLHNDALSWVFTFATNDCQDGKTFCAIRSVCRKWHDLLDQYNLMPSWGRLVREIQHPELAKRISLIDAPTSSLMDIDQAECDETVPIIIDEFECDESVPMDIDQFKEGEPVVCLDSTYFSRFVALTQVLREKGAPVLQENAVIGLELSSYKTMQQRLDTALEAIWLRILEQIDFEAEPIPINAQTIRLWLNDPNNAEKIDLITDLDLSEMNLSVLPIEIGYFTELTRLDLSGNQLTCLPKTIGNLTQLTCLVLENNQLAFLPEEIGNFSLLTELYLNCNELASIPKRICNLNALQELHLDNNKLTSIPERIGNLDALTRLDLHNNQLTSIPEEIGDLSELEELDLENNNLGSVPKEIGDLSKLKMLNLSENKLKSIPKEIGNLDRLTKLRLSKNRLSCIPEEIGNLSWLQDLYLADNQLSCLPETIGQLIHLRALHLNNNWLSCLPEAISNLSQLAEIGLNGLGPQLCLNGNLLLFLLDKDFRELNADANLAFYDDTNFINITFLDFQFVVYKLLACANYTCRTPLAALCQAIHLGMGNDALRDTFVALSNEMQQRIREAWASIPSSSSGSLAAGEDPFAERASFIAAVIIAIQGKWKSLSEGQHNQAYLLIRTLDDKKPNESANGENGYEESNIICLIDAMELTTLEHSIINL